MTPLSTIQILLLLGYAIVVFLIGVWPTGVHGREAFLISGRRLSGFGSGFTIAASKIGGGLLVTYSTLFFAFGWNAAWLFAGNVAGYALFYLFAYKLLEEGTRHRYYTMADYFARRFGKKVGILVGLLSVASLGGWILTNLVAGGKLLAALSGWPLTFSIAAMVILISAYLTVGGFHAVVRTDWLQYAALFVIFVLVAFALASPETQIVGPGVAAPMPIAQIVGFVFLGALFPFGSVELWQRVYATRSRKSLRRAIAIAAASFVVLAALLSLVASSVMNLPSGAELANEVRLPLGVADVLPPALAALWFVAFASAIVSSADTFIFTTAATLVQDVFQRSGLIEEADVVRWLRRCILVLAIVGFGLSVLFPDVVAITFVFVGVTLVLGGAALISWKFSGVSAAGVAVGCVVGTIVTVTHAFLAEPSAITGILAFFATIGSVGIVETARHIGHKAGWIPKQADEDLGEAGGEE